MDDDHQLILSTCPDPDSARLIADVLIDQQLAACVNIIPGLTSIYRWQGKRETDKECLLIIKSKRAVFNALETTLKKAHPYELPEILTVSVTGGSAAYLAWIDQQILPPKYEK